MKRFYLLLLVLVCGLPSFAENKPNIVLILSDDQGWQDYGFMGHEEIKTPHLDALAKRSLLFERGYVASPLCRPSLASIVTGLYPHQHGVTGNDVDGRNNRAALSAEVTEAFHEYPSMIRELVANGYLAHQSGKWWEGSYADGGFTHGMTHADPKRGGRHGDIGLIIGRKPEGAPRQSEGTDIPASMKPIADFMDLAIEEEKPFFVWYAPFLPHTPHNPPKRLLDKYTQEGRPADLAKYFAMCEWFDETCGELMKMLDDREVRENTVVLYVCDNGWATRSSNADDPNQTQWKSFALRSKGSPYENGIRTPIMVSWPAKLTPKRSQKPVTSLDLFPTVCSVSGIQPPDDLPGVDLTDEHKVNSRKAIFGVTHAIHNMTPNYPDGTLQYRWMIMDQAKLLVRYSGENKTSYAKVHDWDQVPIQLFDLKKDPQETVNLVGKSTDPGMQAYLEVMLKMIDDLNPVGPDIQFKPKADNE